MYNLEIGEYFFEWTVPGLRGTNENKSKTFEFYFNGEKVEMSVDLFIGKTRDRREKNYVTKMTPLVYFKQVPKDCSFNMIIKSPNSSAVNIIENKKMELEKSILMYPQRFMDSHNLGKFTLRDGGTVTIEITVIGPKMVDKSSKTNIAHRMKELFKSKMFCDFTFVVDGEEMKVHKAVLAARSQEFRKLFTENPDKSTLNMSDVSKEVFGDFLLFMYTGRFQNLDTTALELLQLAKRFNINIIKQICMSHLKLTLTKEKAPQIFQVSHQQGLVELKMAAFQRIQKTFSGAGKKIPNSMFNAPEKVDKLVDLMKSIDVMLEIEKSLALMKSEVIKGNFDGSVVEKKTRGGQKRVSFAKNDKVPIFIYVVPESDEVSEDEVTDYLLTADDEVLGKETEEEMKTQL